MYTSLTDCTCNIGVGCDQQLKIEKQLLLCKSLIILYIPVLYIGSEYSKPTVLLLVPINWPKSTWSCYCAEKAPSSARQPWNSAHK